MWVTPGNQVGRAGRLLVGGEMLVLYAFNLLALAGLFYRREQLSAWWLWLSAAIGFTAFGLVVVNVGALFRMRYVFCMLIIIVGSEGLVRALSMKRPKGATQEMTPAGRRDVGNIRELEYGRGR